MLYLCSYLVTSLLSDILFCSVAIIYQGRSQDFTKGGGGGHTVSNIIVMAFSSRNIVGYFLKKRITKGGGGSHGHPRTPLATPLYMCNPAALRLLKPAYNTVHF